MTTDIGDQVDIGRDCVNIAGVTYAGEHGD